jgi:hypothetical protein
LRNDQTGKISLFDVALFFVAPLLTGALSYAAGLNVPKDVYNISVTFFGIFIALLLNMQVALLGIYQRKPQEPIDHRLSSSHLARIEIRKQLLSEVNANISYLTLVSAVALLVFLICFAFDFSTSIAAALGAVIYLHFMLSLLMVVKRSHVLFHKEYVD